MGFCKAEDDLHAKNEQLDTSGGRSTVYAKEETQNGKSEVELPVTSRPRRIRNSRKKRKLKKRTIDSDDEYNHIPKKRVPVKRQKVDVRMKKDTMVEIYMVGLNFNSFL